MAEITLKVEENDTEVDMDIDEAQEVLETDHERLTNRDAADSHPKKAITGLEEDLKALREADEAAGRSIQYQGEALASLEKITMRPMTAAEAEEILNG